MKEDFDSSSFAFKNGKFIGLPYTEEEAKVVLLPVPWEVTVSCIAGTARGPQRILDESYQLDLVDWDVDRAWEIPIYWKEIDEKILAMSDETRKMARQYIHTLEFQMPVDEGLLAAVNQKCEDLNNWVYQQTKVLLDAGKLVGLVGGDHSVPLGYLQALSERHSDFGILQIDAHCDLRKAYEGFTYSHASVFYNVQESNPSVKYLAQVGIRDVCDAELAYAAKDSERISIYPMSKIRQHQFEQTKTFQQICQEIIASLPQKVYISFDIDGLDPKLCPNTGTPVPGGLELEETFYLIRQIRKSGRTIIGFDLCEVGCLSEWDGNVGARVLYKLAVEMGSQNLV